MDVSGRMGMKGVDGGQVRREDPRKGGASRNKGGQGRTLALAVPQRRLC